MLGPLVNDGKLNNRKPLLHEEKKRIQCFFRPLCFRGPHFTGVNVEAGRTSIDPAPGGDVDA